MAKRTIDIQLSTKAVGVDTAKKHIDGLVKDAKHKMNNASVSAGRSWTEFFFKWKSLINIATSAWNTLRSAMDSSFKYETMTNSFRFLLQDIDAARVHMQQLKELGDTPPFSLDEFARASKQMMIMSDGVLGFSNSLKMVGDAAAAVGVPVETMGHAVARLYAFIRDDQPLSSAVAELRNMGVLTPEVAQKLQDMQKAGKSNIEIWDEVEKALGKFKGAMEATEKTGEGLVSTIGTKLTNIWRQFTDQLMDKTIPALEKTKNALDALEKAKVGEKVANNGVKALEETGISGGFMRMLKRGQIPTSPEDFLKGALEHNISQVWGELKSAVSGWFSKPMSKEEIAAQIDVQKRKAADPNATPSQKRVAQTMIKQLESAASSAPTTTERDTAVATKAAPAAPAANGSGGNPFRPGTAAYDMFKKGYIDATGKATDAWYKKTGIAKPEKAGGHEPYWDANGQATQAYKDAAAAEKMKAEERAKLEAAMKEKEAAQDLAEAAKLAKKQAEDAVKAERERIQKDISQNTISRSAAIGRIAAAQSEFDRAFAAYRDPEKAAAQIGEERDYAADLKRLHRDASRYAGKWRIDELSRLMAAGDTQGMADTLEGWRKSSRFSPQVEAMVRASAAEQTKTTVEDELRKIETNTAGLSAKLEELISMKGA